MLIFTILILPIHEHGIFLHLLVPRGLPGYLILFALCYMNGIICISELTGISPCNLDSSLCFIQPGISQDVLCIEVKQAGCQYTAMKNSFSNLETDHCSMSDSNCCFLTCIQISQEAGKVVWYSHLLKNFPVCCEPHSQRFSVVNEAEVDVFL